MPSPSYDDRLIAMFDSFCKEVSRNYVKDLVRKNDRRDKYVSHEPVDYLLELLGHGDAYSSHAFTLEMDRYRCIVENKTLYHVLLSLKARQWEVLLLGFWCSFTDGEIAARIQKAVTTLSGNYLGEGNWMCINKMVKAGFSIAMENASKQVKKAADVVTSSNDRDGVAEAIIKFIM